MKNSKIYELISALSKNELARLGEFIKTPFFNTNNHIILLYDYLKNNKDSLTDEVLSARTIFRNIFGNEKYNDQKARLLTHNFLKLAEKFLVITELDEKIPLYRQILLETLQKREMPRNFRLKYNEYVTDSREELNKNELYYSQMISMGNLLMRSSGENINKNLEEQYIESLKHVDYSFMIQKMRMINSLHSKKFFTIGDLKIDMWKMEEIISEIKERSDFYREKHPLIYLEYLSLMMMQNTDTKYFEELKDFVFSDIASFSNSELDVAYYSICNYCFNRIAQNEYEYFNNLFEVYEIFEKAGHYKTMKYIQHIDFSGIIIGALEKPEIKWAEEFREKYSNKLQTDYKEDTLNMTKAKIESAKGNYRKAIELAGKTGNKSSFLYLQSKVVLIQSYYGLKDYEGIFFLVDTMKHYLRRHKDTLNVHYFRYLNFVNYIAKLIRAESIGKGSVKMLMKDASEEINLAYKKWLLEKMSNIVNVPVKLVIGGQ
jgi:hypothetical protein